MYIMKQGRAFVSNVVPYFFDTILTPVFQPCLKSASRSNEKNSTTKIPRTGDNARSLIIGRQRLTPYWHLATYFFIHQAKHSLQVTTLKIKQPKEQTKRDEQLKPKGSLITQPALLVSFVSLHFLCLSPTCTSCVFCQPAHLVFSSACYYSHLDFF